MDDHPFKPPASGFSGWLPLAAAAIALALLVDGPLRPGRDSPPPPTAAPTVVNAVLSPPPPSCKATTDWLRTIQRQIDGGQFEIAYAAAMAVLNEPYLCPDDKRALAGLAVAARLEQILTGPFPGNDERAQRQALTDYRAVQALARQHGVPLPAPLPLSRRAYGIGKWRLAEATFLDALGEEPGLLCQAGQAQYYASLLFNYGQWLRAAEEEALKREGYQYLAASHFIDKTFRVGSGAAAGELRAAFGPDERLWPKPKELPPLPACS